MRVEGGLERGAGDHLDDVFALWEEGLHSGRGFLWDIKKVTIETTVRAMPVRVKKRRRGKGCNITVPLWRCTL